MFIASTCIQYIYIGYVLIFPYDIQYKISKKKTHISCFCLAKQTTCARFLDAWVIFLSHNTSLCLKNQKNEFSDLRSYDFYSRVVEQSSVERNGTGEQTDISFTKNSSENYHVVVIILSILLSVSIIVIIVISVKRNGYLMTRIKRKRRKSIRGE